MKQIQPITVWSNGQQLQADVLDSYVLNDNLSTQAIFYYDIGNQTDEPALRKINALSSGQLVMTGQAYLDYETNNYAWDWIASQLNLTIIGDVTTTTTTTTVV